MAQSSIHHPLDPQSRSHHSPPRALAPSNLAADARSALLPSCLQVVSAIQWLPHRKGVVAVACTEAQSHAERVARMGRPAQAYILIWNFKVGRGGAGPTPRVLLHVLRPQHVLSVCIHSPAHIELNIRLMPALPMRARWAVNMHTCHRLCPCRR